jgi:hypothetical protein
VRIYFLERQEEGKRRAIELVGVREEGPKSFYQILTIDAFSDTKG